MNWKKLFGVMSADERRKVASALGDDSARSSAANAEALARARQEAAARDEELKKMRAEQRTGKVDSYIKAQLEANKIVPAEEAALREEYLQALLDDEQYPVLEGTSRIARIEARQRSRESHLLTEELLRMDLPKGAAVLTSRESDDPIAQARVLVHEVMHAALHQDDDAMARTLGITVPTGGDASTAISDWFKNDCKNPDPEKKD